MTEQEYYLTRCLEQVMPTLLQSIVDELRRQSEQLNRIENKLNILIANTVTIP